MDLEDEATRGAAAQNLLENELFREAFSVVKAEILEQWQTAPARDTEGRERLYVMVRLLEKLRGHIESVAETGKMARKQISDIEERSRLQRAMDAVRW